jgi:hypothetical protein
MIVYLDYDGVFGDTMTPAIIEMKEKGLYDTEEGRTKYFKELDWGVFLKKAGFMKNAIEAINTLMDMGYKVAFLTHVNSLAEHIEKINFIKNIKEIKKPERLDVIAVPRKLDKSFTVNPEGNVLVDDRIENVEAWEVAGGYGIWFSDKESDSYKVTNNLMDVIDIVTNIEKKHLSEKKPIESKSILEKISELIKKYKDTINLYLIYDSLIKNEVITDLNYDKDESTKILKSIKYFYDLIDRKGSYIPTLTYDHLHELSYLILQMEEKTQKEEYKTIANEMASFYNNDFDNNEQNQFEKKLGLSFGIESQPVYKKVHNNIQIKSYYESKGYTVK